MKKILSVLLAVAMIMSFSVCAFAEGETNEEPIEGKVVVADPYDHANKTGGLQAAIDAADPTTSAAGNPVPGLVIVEGTGDFGGAVVNGDDKGLVIQVEGNVVISDPSVGSAGTTTLGLQLLKDAEEVKILGGVDGTSTITFDGLSKESDVDNKEGGKDGNKTMKRGIQEYTNLTLDNVVIDGTDLSNYNGYYDENGKLVNEFKADYENTTISVCAGDLVIDNKAGVLAAEGDNAISVSLYETNGYTDTPTLTVTSDAGTIQGTIVVDGDYKDTTKVTAENSAKVDIQGGNFVNFLLEIGKAVADYAKQNISISGGTFDTKDVMTEGDEKANQTYKFEDFLVTGYVVVDMGEEGFKVMTQADADALNKKDDIVAVIPAETITYVPPVYEAVAGTGNATIEVDGKEVAVKLDPTVVSATAAPVALADEAPVVVKVNVAHTALSANVFTAIEMVETLSETLEVKGADGAVIEAEQYEVVFDGHGQIQIKLSPELMQKLGVGTHVLKINLGGYEIEVTIVIQ